MRPGQVQLPQKSTTGGKNYQQPIYSRGKPEIEKRGPLPVIEGEIQSKVPNKTKKSTKRTLKYKPKKGRSL